VKVDYKCDQCILLIFITSAPTVRHENTSSLPTNEAIDQKEMNVTPSSDHVSQISSLNFAALPSRRETKKTLREEQKQMKIEQMNHKLEEKNNAALKCQLLKHPLLPSCKCRNGRTLQMVKGGKECTASFFKTASCLVSIPEERRVELHEQFWSLFRDARLAWVDKHIELFAKYNSRKLKIGPKTGQNRKTPSRKYFLPGDDGANVEVCKKFFFRTLGYANGNLIRTLFKNVSSARIRPQPDKQDKHNPVNMMSAHDCDTHKKDEHYAGIELTCSVREILHSHKDSVEITKQPSKESAPGGISSFLFIVQ